MISSAFDDDQFSGIYPVSFLMRKCLPECWFRIHSLPDSKRYPEDETNWRVLFQRHRAVTDWVLREGSRCRVHYTLFHEPGVPEDLEPSLNWGEAIALPYEDDQILFTQTAETMWSFNLFQEWVRRRAEDNLGWVSFHSLITDAIYSPYDGGADIFSRDPAFIANVRKEFSAWKSPHPSGT